MIAALDRANGKTPAMPRSASTEIQKAMVFAGNPSRLLAPMIAIRRPNGSW
jgi:hypothetical protein